MPATIIGFKSGDSPVTLSKIITSFSAFLTVDSITILGSTLAGSVPTFLTVGDSTVLSITPVTFAASGSKTIIDFIFFALLVIVIVAGGTSFSFKIFINTSSGLFTTAKVSMSASFSSPTSSNTDAGVFLSVSTSPLPATNSIVGLVISTTT